MKTNKKDFVLRLIIYSILTAIVIGASVLVADIYFGYPFPFGILIGFAISIVIALFHLFILNVKKLIDSA